MSYCSVGMNFDSDKMRQCHMVELICILTLISCGKIGH